MSVSLTKGASLDLTKAAKDSGSDLKKVVVGLGWDPVAEGTDIDLDASVLLLKADGKVRTDKDFVFYNNLKGEATEHTGDNLTGDGDGDDEQIKVDLSALPAEITKVQIVINSYSGQSFGEVKNAFARVVNQDGDAELVKYDLGSEFTSEKAVVMAEIEREGEGWKFTAIGKGSADIKPVLQAAGINA